MSKQPLPFAFPDAAQAMAMHRLFMERLGGPAPSDVEEGKVRASLERATQMVQGGRGDIISLASFLLFGLTRDKPFGERNTQMALALTLVFLVRNGVALAVEPEELAGLALAVARGEVYAGMLEGWLRESARSIGH